MDSIRWDDKLPRFGLRTRGEAESWIVQYRTDTGQRREKIGTPTTLSRDLARKKAKKILAKVELGHDPVAEKRARKAIAAVTFGHVVARYLAVRDPDRPGSPDWKLRPRSYLEVERHLDVQAKRLHPLPLASIKRESIAARLGEIAAESGPVAADRCRTSVSGFFSWVIGEGIADVNPVTGTNKHSDDEPRERVLTNEELVCIWNACADDDYGRIVRLLMLTGQRRQDVGGIADPEIDQRGRLWTIPGARAKNHREHEVPLSDAALTIVREAPRREKRDLLFGKGEGAFSGWSDSKEKIDAVVLKALRGIAEERGDQAMRAYLNKVEDLIRRRAKARGNARKQLTLELKAIWWTPHDIRRTISTRMNDSPDDGGLGILPHIVEAVLNHVSGPKSAKRGVAGVYNHALYTADKRQALDMWAGHLQGLITGKPSNIRTLHVG